MRVLFIDGSTPDVLQAKSAVRTAGHEVDQILPSDTNLKEVLMRPWDVIVMEWMTSPSTVEVLQALAVRNGEDPACIVTSAKATPANIDAAFKAGAEDFLRKPYALEQLSGRLNRIIAQREQLAVAAVRAQTESKTATAMVTGLAAWNGFQSLAAEAVAGVTTLPVVVCAAPKRCVRWLASSMALSLASAQLECRAVVDGDRESLEAFGNAAIGATAPEAVADLLNEIVNTVGGAFMRSAFEENVELTSGLPAPLALCDVESPLESSQQAVICWLADPASGAQLRVRLGVRLRRNLLVNVTSLREGMVLATDLRGSEGSVLLTAGTRITSSTSDRVRRMLDGRRIVEVADTAA